MSQNPRSLALVTRFGALALCCWAACGGRYAIDTSDGTDGVAGGAGAGGSSCQELQAFAQEAADTHCGLDSDCIHPAHVAGDCTDCGVVLNAASQALSFAAVRTVCQRFEQQGCMTPRHSCFAQRAYCDAGVCGLSSP